MFLKAYTQTDIFEEIETYWSDKFIKNEEKVGIFAEHCAHVVFIGAGIHFTFVT